MRKLAIISSHCNTEEKINVLNNNLSILKDLGVDTLVISTVKIDVECDFLYLTKENPLLKWPERCIVAWRIFHYEDKTLKLTSAVEDYGWASLYQCKKGMEIGATYDYDIFYFLIYDLLIDEKIKQDIRNNSINLIYPRKDFNNEKIYPSSLHFAIFDKQKLRLMADLMDKQAYIKINAGFAEDFVNKCVTTMGLEHSEHVVTDLIHLVDTNKIYNLSKNDNYEFFFSKDDKNFKVLFYRITKPITLHINDSSFILESGVKLIESEINCENITSLKVECLGSIDDYMDTFKNKTRNHIYFE